MLIFVLGCDVKPSVRGGAEYDQGGNAMAVNSNRLYIPALGGIYETLSSYAELLLRGGLGVILIVHALQKFLSWFGGSGMGVLIGLLRKFGYPAPVELGYFLAITELSCDRIPDSSGGVCVRHLHGFRDALHRNDWRASIRMVQGRQ
jgi:hypothetical protein